MKIYVETTYDVNDIQNAINMANEYDEIIITSGLYYSKPWDLKSNLTISIMNGARIYFTEIKEYYYDKRFIRFEGVECFGMHPLIYAYGCQNIKIIGGNLFGNGYSFYKYKKLQAKACDYLCYSEANGIKIEDRILDLKNSYLRPDFIEFVKCDNIMFENMKIYDSPMWTIHPVYCKNVLIKNVSIFSEGPNTDGIDPDSCDGVIIDGCYFETGDDCIAINSGLNEDGWRVGIPCQNIEIRNSIFNKGHAAIAIGSGMSGGVLGIYVHNCKINNCQRGIRVKSIPGRGGFVKDIRCKNIEINNCKEGIELTMNYPSLTSKPLTKALPSFKNFHFDNTSISNTNLGFKVIGLNDSFIEDVYVDKLNISNVKETKKIEYCSNCIIN